MFQDIEPYQFHNEFMSKEPAENDFVFISNKDKVLLEDKDGALSIPHYSVVRTLLPEAAKNLIYLFSLDETAFFLSMKEVDETDKLRHQHLTVFRDFEPSWMAFAGATASHLAQWYDTHHYCGRCSAPLSHKADERAVICSECGNIEYPKIAPVVIVGIIDGDRILLTKYAAGYNRYALVAGFVEIGETFEAAVKREVMEEVGLRVKNIRYYKSQPWAFSGSVLAGYFADVDGSDTVTVDTNELAEADWFSKPSIPHNDSTLSLTWTMIEAFRNSDV